MPSMTQLRTYTIRYGLMDEWLAHWRTHVVPLRREHGFKIGAAWLDRERSQFIWALSYEGSDTFEDRDRLADEDTGRYVNDQEIRVVEEEDERFRKAAVVRHSARALLLDGDDLLLWERIVPGRPRYWVTPGGGVEPGDTDLEATLRRELREELGATAGPAIEFFAIHQEEARMTRVNHIFACRLLTLDLAAQTGHEFDDPARGEHKLVRVPFTPEGLASIRLLPEELAAYLQTNVDTVRRLLDVVSG